MEAAAARLIDTPEAPVPPGGVAEVLTGAGGLALRTAYFVPAGRPRGSVILSPGRTEPIEKYFEVVGELLGRGLVVLTHDWRGQGLSGRMLADARKGHCTDWRDYIADYEAMMTAFEARLPGPRIALAHSMAGCFVSLALFRRRLVDAAMFTCPMFGIALRGLPLWAAGLIARLFCALGHREDFVSAITADPLRLRFEGNVLTHDRARWDRCRAQLAACPALALGGPTWGWLRNAFAAVAAARRAAVAASLDIPLLILAAGEERLVTNPPSRVFAARAPRGRYVEIEGARHEIMMEADDIRARFWREFDALSDRLTPPRV